MKNLLRSFPAAVALLLALVPASAHGDGENGSRRVSIETISDLKLSGFNDDEHGELQWTLRAESATADAATASADIRRALWNLDKLQLSTFGKGGETFAEMTSPAGKFSPEKRTAESDARVEVKGADFYVRGNGWSWSGRGHDNLIRVHRDVFVSINFPEKKPKTAAETPAAAETPSAESSAAETPSGTPEEPQKLTALSDQLTIKGSAEETTLVFAGHVKVSYGDIFMACDSLEIVVPATSSKNGADGSAGTGEAKKIAQAVSRIAGRGNLAITRGPLQLSGRSAEFLPQESVFRVRGNATLANTVSLLFVRGDEAIGRLDENFVEVRAVKTAAAAGTKNTGTADAPHGTVSIEMPSFVEKKSDAAGTTSGGRTLITGDRLTVFNAENENVISLFGNVSAADGNIKIGADTLAVTTEPTLGNALDAAADAGGTARRNEFSKIRVIAAAGNVRAEYSGRVLTCGRADVFPQENLILLTEAPQIVSEEEDATLSGDRAEVRLDRDEIAVFGAEGDAPERRRVFASLPPFSGKDLAAGTQNFSKKSPKKSAETVPAEPQQGRTELRGDVLTLSRDAELSTFDFSGDVSLNSAELDAACGRITVFADPKRPKKSAARGAKDELSQIKKIIADKNIRLEQNGYELTGGRAVITPGISLKEWIEDDADAAADGRAPFFITVEPDADTGTRPRIRFPGGETGAALEFALPIGTQKSEKTGASERAENAEPAAGETAGKKAESPHKSSGFISGKLGETSAAGTAADADAKSTSAEADIFGGGDLPRTKKYEPKAAQAAPVPAPAAKKKELPKESYLESDAMELIAGEKRARFFLRGDVILVAGNGAQGLCDTVEGLLESRAPAKRAGTAAAPKGSAESSFEAKKVICRGDVRMKHEESSGRGDTLEIFPPQNRAILSGNAFFRGKDGITLHPGNDRFVFDMETRQMITGAEAGADDAIPAQVSRPQIIIPPGGNRVFVVPKSVRGKDK